MKFFLSFSVLFITIAVIKTQTVYDVTKYGADSKGAKKSTDAIKKAIDAAVAKGGGTVFFPVGEYLTGPINLKSHITLHLADKTVIKFSKDHADYPPLKVKLSDGEQETKFTPLIYAYGEQNIGIIGKGVLDGQGSAWWSKAVYNSWKNINDSYYQMDVKPEVDSITPYELTFLRPPFIHLFECKKIVLEDITVKNSPFWNVNPVYSDDITIKGITIENPEKTAPNTDGINCYSCTNTVISKVTINTGDDCIALDAGVLKTKRPTENLHISDSHMGKGHAGVAIGSSCSGGLKNITVTNCVFTGTDRGLYIKTDRERGGTVENINYSGITMNDIQKEGIALSMVYAASGQDAALHDIKNIPKKAVTSTTPVIRNINFKDIKGSAKTSIWFVGVPESPISDIKLTNVDIKTKNEMSFTNTKNVDYNGKKES